MKKTLPYLFLLLFLSCQKFQSETLYTQEELDIINEETDGVVVFLYNSQVYSINDLGQNLNPIPNTLGANALISLNFTKDKVAYFNNEHNIEIVDLNGNNKEILTQYNARYFEWSKKEDVLFMLESGSSTITTHGNSNSFMSPAFAVNIYVDKFCVSEDYHVAYSSEVINPPYSDVFIVQKEDNMIMFEVFSGQTKFKSLQYTSENKIFGAFEQDNHYIYSFSFDPLNENINDNLNYIGFQEDWTLDVQNTNNSYLKNVEDFSDNNNGYNIFRFREDGTRKRITSFKEYKLPILFDWKK